MSEKTKDLTDLLGFVSASKYREKVIAALLKAEKTVTQISEESGMYKSHVSKMVKELEEKGVAECLNPDRRKGKLFTLTEKGERAGSRLSISKEFSGLELKIAKVFDHLSIPFARNVKLGPDAHKGTADFVILDGFEPKMALLAKTLPAAFPTSLRESVFLVGMWKKETEGLKTALVLGGVSKEKAMETAKYFVRGEFFDSVIHEGDLECIREKELGLDGILEVEKYCGDWPDLEKEKKKG